MLRKLSKKRGLTREKHEKGAIYLEDPAVIMQTNLTATKKKYTLADTVSSSPSFPSWPASLGTGRKPS